MPGRALTIRTDATARRSHSKEMTRVVKELRQLVQLRAMQMAVVPFYKSKNFDDDYIQSII